MLSDIKKLNSVSLRSVFPYVSLNVDIYICFTLDDFRHPIAKLSLASLGFSFMYLFYDNNEL